MDSRPPRKRRFLEDEKLIFFPTPPNRFMVREGEVAAYRAALLQDVAQVCQQLSGDVEGDTQDPSQLKSRLIEQLKSPDRETVVKAICQLEQRGWLKDGTLNGVSLEGAALSRIVLSDASLIGATLSNVMLSGAYLRRVDLQSADLRGADLSGAILEQVNLRGAVLDGADLRLCWIANREGDEATVQDASLNQVDLRDAVIMGDWRNASIQQANLQGAWMRLIVLHGVNFTGSNLRDAVSDFVKWGLDTILPDGNPFHHITNHPHRYKDARRPDFWNPDQQASLASSKTNN